MTQKAEIHPGKVNRDGKMRSIEGARGIAALLVVCVHSANLMRVEQFSGHIGLGDLFGFGYVGVDFFFVLSGFIITYVHAQDIGKPQQIPIYLWRRLSRIYPIFWCCLGLAVLIQLSGKWLLGKSLDLDFSTIDIFGTIFLIQVAEPKFLGVAWTLQFEVMFYVLFCVLLMSRNFGILFLTTWAAAILSVLLFPDLMTAPVGFFSSHCLQFILGIGVGFAARHCKFSRSGPAWLALILSMAGFIAAVFYETSIAPALHGDIGRILLGFASAAILLSLIALEKMQAIRTPKFLYLLGSVSYSIYLLHIVFINVVYSLLLKMGLYHRLPEAVIFVCGAGIAIAGAVAIGIIVELPLVRHLKNVVRNKRLAAVKSVKSELLKTQ